MLAQLVLRGSEFSFCLRRFYTFSPTFRLSLFVFIIKSSLANLKNTKGSISHPVRGVSVVVSVAIKLSQVHAHPPAASVVDHWIEP